MSASEFWGPIILIIGYMGIGVFLFILLWITVYRIWCLLTGQF